METESQYPPRRQRLAIVFLAMLGTVMTMLDTTIANVALPHMRSTLGATQEQINWVLTSYIVATAVVIPATGFLEQRLGRRQLFTFAVAGFTLSSAVCGLAWSLPTMIIARLVQGLCGAVLAPMAQTIMYDVNPPEERTQAMTIWSMGVMMAPVFGPVLGGWLTDSFSWRWVFYINLPIGVVAAIGAWKLIPSPKVARQPFDAFGYVLIITALCAFQLMLDRGAEIDWFNSNEIWLDLGLGVAALWMYVVHTLTAKAPLIPLRLFKDRNFVVACIIIVANSGAMMAAGALMSPLIQGLMGYGTTAAGILMMPRGLAMACSMITAGWLSSKIDPRIIVGLGIIIGASGQFILTGMSPAMDSHLIILAGVVQGFGLGYVFLPLNMIGFASLSPDIRTYGASVFALARNYGGSIMIAVSTAFFAHNIQINHNDLVGGVTSTHFPLLSGGIIEQFGFRGSQALGFVDMMINQQGLMISYIDAFYVLAVVTIAGLPLILLATRVKVNAGEVPLPDVH